MKKNKTPKRKIRSGRGALLILSLIFVSSAGLRMASGTGAALAKEIAGASAEQPSEDIQDPMLCAPSEDTAALIYRLREREDAVSEQELLIAQRWKAIELAKLEVQENLAVLQEAEERLQASMTRASTAAEEDLSKLTAVYESMKPKEAAALFEAMSPEFAAGFLSRMRSDAAGAIMAGLPPETAYSISVILAGRNANAPSE